MHDWTLLNVNFRWEDGELEIKFKNQDSKVVSLISKDTKNLILPKKDDWGKSASVNEVKGPLLIGGNLKKIEIEMQSGDIIEILSSEIIMPF